MVFIYALVCEGLVLYVGRTVNMADRERGHRCVGNDTGSRHIPYWIEWEMKLLEEAPDDQGVFREQHYYDTLKPLYNINRPGQTDKEYYIKQRDAGINRDNIKRYRATEAGKAARKSEQEAYRLTEGYRLSQAKYYEKRKAARAAKKATP